MDLKRMQWTWFWRRLSPCIRPKKSFM
jgi:hypothetical protein